jgi:hypothetical protein
MKTIAQRMGTIGLQILAAWAASGGFLCALAQASPKGPVVLTVSGKINASVSSQVVTFDMAMLQAMPQKTWTTRTPWDVHQVTFSGPLLRDVLAAVKASGSELRAVALNDYRVRIPVSDAEQFDVVVALRMNGKPIPVRTKGPLFIVYPFDANPVLQAKLYYERAIWQLKAIEVE